MQREDVIRILKAQQKTLAERYNVERLSLDDIPPLIESLEYILKQT